MSDSVRSRSHRSAPGGVGVGVGMHLRRRKIFAEQQVGDGIDKGRATTQYDPVIKKVFAVSPEPA